MKTARVISEADIVPHRCGRLSAGQRRAEEPGLGGADDQHDRQTARSISSLEDYIAWDRGLRAGALLKPASWAQGL